jgi:hypothetical protein
MFDFRKLVVKYLKDIIQRIESDDCELSDDEAMDILKVIAHRPLSKEQACRHLNMSRSKFDEKVRLRLLPKGRKRVGHKELDWYEDELILSRKK